MESKIKNNPPTLAQALALPELEIRKQRHKKKRMGMMYPIHPKSPIFTDFKNGPMEPKRLISAKKSKTEKARAPITAASSSPLVPLLGVAFEEVLLLGEVFLLFAAWLDEEDLFFVDFDAAKIKPPIAEFSA